MKPNFFSPLPAALAALSVFAGGTASADQELDLRANLGYDSNVFALNESNGERGGVFSLLEAEFKTESKSQSGRSVGLDVGAAAQLYESSLSDGDETKYFIRVRGDSGAKRREQSFDWALRYRLQDSTYISRFTGVMASVGAANTIGDRFDSSDVDLRGAWHLPARGYGRISLKSSAVTKNYLTDYSSLGLERLDYNEFGLEPQYEMDRPNGNFRIGLTLALRQYRDRRVSNVSGNPIAGTDLEYRYYGLDAGYERQLTRTSVLEFSGGYDIREDNGIGVDDRTRWNAGVEWTYRPVSQTRLSVQLEWSSRVFDRPASGDPTVNDEAPEKKGYGLNVKYVRPFPGVKIRGVTLLAEARWESFDNTDDIRLSYDRLMSFAGIRKEF